MGCWYIYIGSFVTGFNPVIGCIVVGTHTLIGTVVDLTPIDKVAPITSLFLKVVGSSAATYFILNTLAPITFANSFTVALCTFGTGLVGIGMVIAVAAPIFCLVGCGIDNLKARLI